MSTKNKYITRIDHRNTHGWFVRVYEDSKPVKPKLFSDGVHGSKPKALALARKYRDKMCKQVFGAAGVPESRRVWGRGVYERVWVNSQGYKCRAWLAFWSEKGRQVRRSFSVAKYGPKRAKLLATQARDAALKRRR